MKIPPTLVEWMHLINNNFPFIEQHISLGSTFIEFNKTSHGNHVYPLSKPLPPKPGDS